MVKIFTIVTGDTWNAHKTFVENLAVKILLTEVQRLEECDVILEFCPVSSRPGPDIDAALNDIPANKPAVLVVMHQTCDPNRSVYDTAVLCNYVTQCDVLSVDCLFHESKGLFRCPANDEAVGKTLRHITKYAKEPLPVQQLTKYESSPVPVLTDQKPLPAQRLTECQEPCSDQVKGLIKQTSCESLREKIIIISPTAARNMHAAGVSDAQMFTLTLPEMTELLPGMENFQKRREIMDLIKQRFETSSLREKISNISQMAAENLCAAGVSDAQIFTLTLPELTELLPGMENFQKRREIMDLIRQHFELQVPEVLLEHRRFLKEQEKQLQAALDTIRLQIDLLDQIVKREELPGKQPCEGTKSLGSVASNGEPSRPRRQNKNSRALLGDPPSVNLDKNRARSSSNYNSSPPSVTSTPVQTDKKAASSSPSYNSSPTPVTSTPLQTDKKATSSSPSYNSSPTPVTSTPVQTDKKATSSSPVKVHISGDPPMGRSVFLNKLGVRIMDSTVERCSVILSLCPVTSLTGRELRVALSKIPDDKDAILVVIHQSKQTLNPRCFVEIIGQKRNIVETVHYISYQSSGVTNYGVNDQAISRLRLALQRYGSLS